MKLMLIKYLSLKKNHMTQTNSFKYFIRYYDNDAIRPLYIKIPKITGYVIFEGNTTMSFKISNKQLLKKYNQIWTRSWTIIESRIWQRTCLWW